MFISRNRKKRAEFFRRWRGWGGNGMGLNIIVLNNLKGKK